MRRVFSSRVVPEPRDSEHGRCKIFFALYFIYSFQSVLFFKSRQSFRLYVSNICIFIEYMFQIFSILALRFQQSNLLGHMFSTFLALSFKYLQSCGPISRREERDISIFLVLCFKNLSNPMFEKSVWSYLLYMLNLLNFMFQISANLVKAISLNSLRPCAQAM